MMSCYVNYLGKNPGYENLGFVNLGTIMVRSLGTLNHDYNLGKNRVYGNPCNNFNNNLGYLSHVNNLGKNLG